jgi:hypothetical protein
MEFATESLTELVTGFITKLELFSE